MKAWPPVACPVPWAVETWLLPPGRGSHVAHSQIILWLLPWKAVCLLQRRPGCVDHSWLSWAALPGLHLLNNSSSQSSSSPSAFPPLLPLSRSPLLTGTWKVQSPSSPLASPHLSHHLSQPLQPEPSSLTSPRCLSLKTIFSNGPQGNSFLRHLDSETPRVIPHLLLPLSAPVPQNPLLPNRIVPETQNLVI